MSQKQIIQKRATPDPNDLIRDAEVAAMTGVEPRVPAQWRYLGRFKDELPYFKIGRSVRYRRGDVEQFVLAKKIGGIQAD